MTRAGLREGLVLCTALVACSSGATPSRDAAAEVARDAPGRVRDGAHDGAHDAARDGGRDARGPVDAMREVGSDAPVPTAALVRLANWSPDAPGIDLCVAPHGTSIRTGPLLVSALGGAPLGLLTITDAGLPVDAGRKHVDAGTPGDAGLDGPRADAGLVDGSADAPGKGPDAHDASTDEGLRFPRVSPYVTLAPGVYDVRVVGVVPGAAPDCATPLFADVDDLPALRAGDVQTFAAVGDMVDQGTDPGIFLTSLADDTTVAASQVALRFVNAVPSVIEVTFASGLVYTGSAAPYIVAAQFGGAGVDTDAGALDSNDYLTTAPIHDQVWSLINANGGTTTLVAVEGASIPAGVLATVVAIGGESGATENAIGILVCTDAPPIVAGETASCVRRRPRNRHRR